MKLPSITDTDWDVIADQLRVFNGSLLESAFLAGIDAERAGLVADLDSPTADHLATQYTRGQRAGLARARVILLDDIARLASRRAAHGDLP